MNATAPAVRPDPPAPARRRRFFRGVAAAGLLSLAVHAAVLLVRPTTGSGAAAETRPGSVLVTRVVPSPDVVEASAAAPAQATPEPVVEPVAPAEPVQPTVEPTHADAPAARPVEPEVRASSPIAPPPALQPAASQPAPSTTARPDESAATTSAPAAATYRGAAGLEPPPRLLVDVDPVVPAAAGQRGGVVVLRLFINEQGVVDRAEVLSSTPPGLFDASAPEAFGNARFAPGYFGGVPVRSQVTFEVRYRDPGGKAVGSKTY